MSGSLVQEPGYCDLSPGGKGSYAIVISMLVITTVLVSIRIHLRTIRTKEFGWDDGMLLLGYTLMIATLGVNLRALAVGFGRRSACNTAGDNSYIRFLESLAQFLGIYSGLFSRLATALLILRVFGVTRGTKRFIFIYSTFQVLVLGITGILTWFQCTPSRSIWDSTISHTCWSSAGRQALADLNGVVSILSDFIAIVIPAYAMWYLMVPNRLKIIVISCFALSLGPIACAIARMILHYTLTSPDFSYGETPLSNVFTLETSLLVACAAVPTLPGVFRRKHKETTSYEMPLAKTSNQRSEWTPTDGTRSTDTHWSSRNNSSVSAAGKGKDSKSVLHLGFTSTGLTVR